jgi:hypothetical protein
MGGCFTNEGAFNPNNKNMYCNKRHKLKLMYRGQLAYENAE